MGYHVRIVDCDFTIPTENFAEAYKALCELNNHNELKRGGRSPCVAKDGPHDGVWFSWMDWNYPEKCNGLVEVLEHVGFDVGYDEERGITYLDYDAKMGNEDVFLNALAPFVNDGSYIEWEGEEDEVWKHVYSNGKMKEISGRKEIVWAEDGTY